MPTAIFEKDPTPPSTLHQNAPIVIPDGTWLATTLQLNNLIDRTGGLYALDGQRVLVTDAFGNMEVSAITTTEIGYLSGVTSNIQQQIDKTRRIIKSADESRTSSGSYLDDSEMTLTVEANTKYYIKVIVIATAVNNVGRIKYRLSGPAGATSKTSNSALNAQTANVANEIIGGSGWTHSSGDATERMTSIEGTIIISSTAGSITVQWAQAASDAGATVMKAGAILELRKA